MLDVSLWSFKKNVFSVKSSIRPSFHCNEGSLSSLCLLVVHVSSVYELTRLPSRVGTIFRLTCLECLPQSALFSPSGPYVLSVSHNLLSSLLQDPTYGRMGKLKGGGGGEPAAHQATTVVVTTPAAIFHLRMVILLDQQN